VSLPTQVVDRLFTRLAATYGSAWDRSMGQAPIGDVKSAWAYELQGFARNLDALAWGLENLPEKCPNVIEFRNLCRKAPEPELPKLPEPPANPERLKAELAKLGKLREAPASRGPVDISWAQRIVARADGGQRVAPLPLRMAREVLAKHERRAAA
jgi:hypothetical protein